MRNEVSSKYKKKEKKWLCSSCLSYWWKFTQTLWPLMHSIWPVLCMQGTTAFGAQTWSNKHLAPLKFTSSNVVILHTIEWKSAIRHRIQGTTYTVYSTRYTGLNLKYPDPPYCTLIKNLLQRMFPFWKALRSRNLSSSLIACLMRCRLTVALWQSFFRTESFILSLLLTISPSLSLWRVEDKRSECFIAEVECVRSVKQFYTRFISRLTALAASITS